MLAFAAIMPVFAQHTEKKEQDMVTENTRHAEGAKIQQPLYGDDIKEAQCLPYIGFPNALNVIRIIKDVKE